MTDKLAPLLEPLTSLPGLGPANAPLLERACGGGRVLDLLLHMPERLVDRSERPTIAATPEGSIATWAVDVVSLEPPSWERQPWRVVVTDGSGFAELTYFKRRPPADCVAGARVLVSGKFELYNGRPRMSPDHLVREAQAARLPRFEPIWPLTAGLGAWVVSRAMAGALRRLPDFPEWHDAALLRREAWPDFATALRALHAPEAPPGELPRKRLAYDELLAHQLAIAWLRRRVRNRPGRALTGDNHLRAHALAAFGHRPTPSQLSVLAEIDADLAAPRRMLRLLQGDVGSGKTLVALLAMLRAVEGGAQAALMAPTEVLAFQHHRTLSALSPVPVALLTGSVKGAARRSVLEDIASGAARLIVGTHALFQRGVEYHDLGLAVIDEQHRFGVDQRLLMGAKGAQTDVLVMTATPIPRTLLLTQWGEMGVSRLMEKPGDRPPIRTSIHSLSNLSKVIQAVARAISKGVQVFWVCPVVAGSKIISNAAAIDRHDLLRRGFGPKVALAHGQMDPADRDAALAGFASGEMRLLVATTVVEVGVDVPAASVMVIEHAECFGLAQLHQLRGRVGRGHTQSYCLLLYDEGAGEAVRRRLTLLRDTEDGFVIADEDFRLRGGGDLLGTRQSGLPGWRIADPVEHEGLLHMAARDAELVLDRDPKLETDRGHALRLLLRLFDRGTAMRTLRSG